MESEKRKLLDSTHQLVLEMGIGNKITMPLSDIVSPEIVGLGTAIDEKIFGIQEVEELLKRQKEQTEGIEVDWNFKTLNIHISPDENTAVIIDEIFLKIVADEELEMYLRFSMVLEYVGEKWFLIHWHGSKPEEVASEEDTWGIESWKEKAEALEKQVAERTADLLLKNRELEIEAALERVRAKTMAMHKSEDLSDAAVIAFQQLKLLGFIAQTFGFIVFNKKDKTGTVWLTPDGTEIKQAFTFSVVNDPTFKSIYSAWENKESYYIADLTGKRLENHLEYVAKHMPVYELIERSTTPQPNRIVINAIFYSHGFLGFNTDEPIGMEIDLLQRFAKVFDQTYTRFLDLKKAEEQAREAQIEVALEKVRSASMAMHKSEELNEVATELFQQIRQLGGNLWTCGIVLCQKDSEVDHFMVALENGMAPTIEIPNTKDPSTKNMYYNWKNGADYYVEEAGGKDLKKHYDYLETLPTMKPVIENLKASGISLPTWQKWHAAYFTHGYLMIITLEPYPQEEVFKRFAKVFEQTYIRFLDLKKAEEQAREAQIEVALERVRSRSLAMHKTDELQDVVRVVAEELKNTGVILDTWGAVICTYFQDSKDVLHWTASEEPTNPSVAFLLPYFEDELFDEAWESKVRGDNYFAKVFSFEVKNTFFNHAFTHSDYRQFPEDYKKQILESETHGIAWAWAKNSAIMIPSIQGDLPSEEEKEILIRFARVFEQSFIRFLDLQKAEAQTREAEIEAALEKVRSRSLAMHKSDELNEVVKVLFEKMIELQVPSTAIGIQTFSEESKDMQVFVCGDVGTGIVVNQYLLPYFDHPIIRDYLNAHKEKPDYFVGNYPKKEKDSFYDVVLKLPELKDLPIEVKTMIRQSDFYEVTMVPAEKSLLAVNDFKGNPLSESHINILKRFTKVFDQTYIRFLDLQKAEARAKESQIETALERVRSRTMGMQQSEELGDVATVLFNEMNGLVDDLWTCGFVLCEENSQEDEWWLSMEDGFTRGFLLPNVGDFAHETLYEGWEKGESFRSVQLEGKELDDHYEWLMKMPVAEKIFIEMEASGISRPKWQKLHAAYFKTGYLVIITEVPCAEEEIFKRFAQVFDLTYTRFLDLQQKEEQGKKLIEEKIRLERTLKDLQATQAQLIQSEKMASLGELTAGIAHEIQNPLNFVNNFSEVSGELVDEMNEEIEKGDLEEVKFIAADLKENLTKINHHGKRADAIVKGMLEHSRANKGEKAPTDLNALVEEFVRLSYHGLRAKDKSFNADFKLDLDPALPKVNVIASDIGRVILNLVNNAFYACAERSRSTVNEKAKSTPQTAKEGKGYQPEVIVNTRVIKSPSGDLGVEISVKDNGPGIPDSIKAKIFQPFFTTKPTGSGTGLGLSLSYDIVKAHGGEISVESEQGVGTEFIVALPFKINQ